MNSEESQTVLRRRPPQSSPALCCRLSYLLLWLLPTLVIAGCGSTGPVAETVPVVKASGKLTFQGKPLEHYQLMLFPKDGRPAAGMVDASGNFVLGTNQPGDGAPSGTHRLAVTWVGPPSTDPGQGVMEFAPPPPPTIRIPDKYADPETSGITVEIPDSGTDSLAIDLT